MQRWPSGVQEHSDKHALGNIPKAQCAFKILMIHEVLQFALRSHFAAFFIVVGSKTSIAESCNEFHSQKGTPQGGVPQRQFGFSFSFI